MLPNDSRHCTRITQLHLQTQSKRLAVLTRHLRRETYHQAMSVQVAKPYPGELATASDVRLLADHYRKTAHLLQQMGRPGDPLSRAPFRLAAIHAIELYLKCAAPASRHRSTTDQRHAARPGPAHTDGDLERPAPEGANRCSPLDRRRAARISRDPVRSRTCRHGIPDKQARRDPGGGRTKGDTLA